MKRRHLIEIEDQAWCPRAVRNTLTDCLQFQISRSNPYRAILPLLAGALQQTGAREILDLCSGGGGPWLSLHQALLHQGVSIPVCLTDKFPNTDAFERSRTMTNRAINFHPAPVDATRVPEELRGFRTMFTSFHHFRPDQAKAVLADAVRHREGIGIFEATHRSLTAMFLMMVVVPLAVLMITPFIRPFRWHRIFWTYLIPLAPFVTLFDGVVSCLRTYSVLELKELTQRLDGNGYQWEVGSVMSEVKPIRITYLIGVPTVSDRE